MKLDISQNPHTQSNFIDRQIGRNQQILGLVDPILAQVFIGGLAGAFFKEAGKMIFADTGHLCHIVDGNFFVKILPDKFFRLIHPVVVSLFFKDQTEHIVDNRRHFHVDKQGIRFGQHKQIFPQVDKMLHILLNQNIPLKALEKGRRNIADGMKPIKFPKALIRPIGMGIGTIDAEQRAAFQRVLHAFVLQHPGAVGGISKKDAFLRRADNTIGGVRFHIPQLIGAQQGMNGRVCRDMIAEPACQKYLLTWIAPFG